MADSATTFTALSLVLIFIIGLGLGATSTLDDFRAAAAKPKAVACGWSSQYLFLPVFAYALCQMFQIDPIIAIGCVLVGASPGGTTSNIFTYWSKGDVALSITMSFLSTLAAFFMMPFWIYVLVTVAYNSDVQIAWVNIVLSLMLILIPTVSGLAIRHYNTEYQIWGKFIWQWIELFTTIFGVIFLIAALVSSLIIYNESFRTMPVEVWCMALILQPAGCAFGYFAAKFFGMSGKDQRTISLETGVQNFTLTIAVINVTFKGDVLEKALLFPLAYGLLYFGNSGFLVAFYRYYLAQFDGEEGAQKVPTIEKEVELESTLESPTTIASDTLI